MLLAYEATRSVAVEDREVSTPVSTFTGTRLAEPPSRRRPHPPRGPRHARRDAAHPPHRRGGIPRHGPRRDDVRTHRLRRPAPDDLSGRQIFVVDPMLATGGTLAMAIDFLLARGARDVTAVCLVSAPEGVKRIEQSYGESAHVEIYTAALDERLNEQGYIVPGLGDAGDRMYGIVD